MLAFAVREMRLTEEQFWEMTPRKFYWLMIATQNIIVDTSPFGGKKSTTSNTTQNTTIDNIPGWD